MTILDPSDFPAKWWEKYARNAARYRACRLWPNDREADLAAFRDVRCQYWSSLGLDHHGNPQKTPPAGE